MNNRQASSQSVSHPPRMVLELKQLLPLKNPNVDNELFYFPHTVFLIKFTKKKKNQCCNVDW